jgi:hypothetical protein
MTVHLLPIPVAREELDLRLRSIKMPPEAIPVVEMLGPLDDLDHRLAGVVWKVIGREVPPTEDIPDYPFLRLNQAGAPWRQVQIWEWHICPPDPPAFAVYRWHPWGDEGLHFVNLSQNRTERERQCTRLGKLFDVTKYRYKLGRPMGTGNRGVGKYRDADSFLEAALRERNANRRRGIPFTQATFAEQLGITEGTFKRGLRKHQPPLNWQTFLDLP